MIRLLLTAALLFPFFHGAAQNALNFVGNSWGGDLVNTNQPAITGNAARTVEAWVKIPNPAGTTQQVIFDMGDFVTGGRFTFNIINGQNLRIEIGGSGISGTKDITDDAWHHVAVTYHPGNATGQKAKLYIDGLLHAQGDFTVPVNTAANAATLRIGIRADGNNGFTGTIDELRVWNVERSAAQIAADRNNSYCVIPPGLIAYFKFNEGIPGGVNTYVYTVANLANPAYNGILYSFAKTGATSNFVSGILADGTSGAIAPVACASYTTPSGKYTLTSSGVYYDTIVNTSGCDSIITINLNISGSSPVANLAVSNLTPSSATLTWDSVIAAAGYEYALTTSSAPPVSGTLITDTFYNAMGLPQGTRHYFHVRTYCGPGKTGPWVTITFETIPTCYSVTGTTISGITPVGATFTWDLDADATWYEYLITSTPAPPGPSLAGSGTYKTSYTATHLDAGMSYYFHVRKRCNNKILSPWVTETFTTSGITTSINEPGGQIFSVSPNPTKDKVTVVAADDHYRGNMQVTVTDVLGKMVHSSSSGNKQVVLDLGDQPAGIYFIRLSTGDHTYVKQLMVSR